MKNFTAGLLVLALIQVAMSIDPVNFFNLKDGDLTKITWAHAVNGKDLLNQTLSQANISMIEADVVLGRLNNSMDLVPIMAHPPQNTSDLSLQDFLDTFEKSKATKGVKLDFKSIDALKNSSEILKKLNDNAKFPVFINADILLGPVNATNATTVPVDAASFFSETKSLKNCTLSVGWTTRYGKEVNVTEGGYTDKQIEEMVKLLKEHQVTQPISYPVRAGPAANSADVIKKLMATKELNSTDVTLTVWSHKDDKVDAGKLSTLIKEVGLKKVYVDVPEELLKDLKLSSAASVNAASFVLATSLLVLLSGYL